MKWKKVLFILLSVFIMGIVLFGYSIFNGVPFKKAAVAQELETHLEEKYKMDFHLQETQYNFVDGNYGAIFYPDAQEDLEFRAEKWTWNGNYYDEYPEAIWKNQATEELTPIIKEHFPVYEELMIAGVSSVSYDMEIEKEIPHYSQVPASLYMVIDSSEYWSAESEKKEAENLYKVIQDLQKQNISIEVTLYFKEEEAKEDIEKPVYHSITISEKDFDSIQSPEDVLQYSFAF